MFVILESHAYLLRIFRVLYLVVLVALMCI